MRLLTLLLASATLATVLTSTPVEAAPKPPSPHAHGSGRDLPVAARDALARVDAMFNGRAAGQARSIVDPTIAFRDLAATKNELPLAERLRAERYLARPTDGTADPNQQGYDPLADVTTTCSSGVFCLNYVKTTVDHATTAFAAQVEDALLAAHTFYVDAGYRAPLTDSGGGYQGGSTNTMLDVYLADLGSGLLGYCTSDDPGLETPGVLAGWAYCVLDNDFDAAQYGFPTGSSLAYMKSTAAHEYFHAIQYGYDAFEDGWFMESTAAWAEGQVFDDINLNVDWLRQTPGPMGNTRVPVDRYLPDVVNTNFYSYWLLFEYLGQRYGPAVVRSIWEKADGWTGGSTSAPNMHGIQAARSAVFAAGGDWNDIWRRFADANRRPKKAYAEARSGEATYPNSPLKSSYFLTPSSRTRSPRLALDHLTSAIYRFTPSKDMQWGWKLKVTIDGNTPGQGGAGLATMQMQDGTFKRVAFDFDSSGVRTKTMTFSRGSVAWIEITIVNASTRTQNCWTDGSAPFYSCFGAPLDDNRITQVTATAVKS